MKFIHYLFFLIVLSLLPTIAAEVTNIAVRPSLALSAVLFINKRTCMQGATLEMQEVHKDVGILMNWKKK